MMKALRPVIKTSDEVAGEYHQFRKGTKVVFPFKGHMMKAKVADRRKQFCKVNYSDHKLLSTVWFSVGDLTRADVAQLNASLYPLVMYSTGFDSFGGMQLLLVESK